MTRLAETRPPYCAACFQHPGELRCVDFEAAYDGPTIPGAPSPIPIDDLVLCEQCLAAAFAILDPQGLKQTIAELEQAVRDQAEEIRAKDKAIKGAKFTIQELEPLVVHSKIPGKPSLFGVEDDVRKILTQRQYERGPTSPKSAKKPRRKKEPGEPTPESGAVPVENATAPQSEEVPA
jgi:hypothetical protein